MSMLLVSAFGSATMTGLNSGYLSLKEALYAYVREGEYPDAVITTNVTSRTQLEALLAVPGVEQANARLVGDVMIISPAGRYLSVRAMSFDEDEFQKIYYWEQAEPGNLDPVFLEYHFARNNGISAGDTIQVKVEDEYRSYAVAGIVSRPETLSMELSDDISIKSNDFGFAYVPRALLEKETEAERHGSMRELDEKSSEFSQSEQEAQQEYQQALTELNSAKAELNEKKEEFAQTHQELESQRAELEETREELLRQRQELAEKKAEAESNQTELNQKRAEALEKEAELKKAQRELNEKQAELNAAGKTLAEQRTALLRAQKQALAQGIILLQTENQLLSAKTELERARAEAIDKRGDLHTARKELTEKRDILKEALRLLRQAKNFLSSVSAEDALRKAEGLIPSEWDQVQEKLRSMLGSYAPAGNITEDSLDAAISSISPLYDQADRGLDRVNDGLQQIRDGLNLAKEKEMEIDFGLLQVQIGQEQLNGGLRQIEDGFRQISQAADQIAEGNEEAGSYHAQIDDGWRELNGGLAQIADYQAQLDDGFAQIEAGQEEISSALAQIEDGIRQIDEAVAEAQAQLTDGEKQLADKQEEVNNGWIQALAEFSDIKNELQSAYDQLSEWEGYETLCNQFLLRFSTGTSPEAVLREAKAALEDVGVQKAVLFDDSPVKQRIDENLIPMETLSTFIPAFFFGISMIVVYLFMALMIRQCRREIGILRALGFSRLNVTAFFCAIGFLVSLGAIVLGLVISLGVRGYLCRYFFDLLFHIPVRALVFNWSFFFLSAALTVAAVLLSTLISASAIGSIQPSEAMTRQKPSTFEIPRPVRRAIRAASPFLKFSIISLLRSKLRFVFSSFCLASSVMLIFTSFSLISSSKEILNQVFDRCIHYDCQIFLRADAEDGFFQDLAALPYVWDVENLDYYVVDISFNGCTETAAVSAVREDTALISVENQNKTPVSITGNGIILERHLAEKLHAAAGDSVRVGGVSMPVTAVSEQSGSRFQYITDVQAAALGSSTLHSLIFRISLDHENELMQFLAEQEEVIYASFTRAAYAAYAVILSGVNIVSFVLICIAIAIGLVIVVNTSQTNLMEQKKELCVLRTLGFQHREISRYWFAQSILHFGVSCVFGFPAGIALTINTLRHLETANRTYSFMNDPLDYALTAALVLAFIALSHFYTMRSLKRWDIVEVVKEKE